MRPASGWRYARRGVASDPRTETIDTIRALAMDAVQQANAGHPGTAMALAPLAYLLYRDVLRHNPADPHWPGRDRFVLSAGHACMLQYASLHLAGYDLTLDDLKQFRQWGSRTPGHPERGHTAGIETTTGPLGQGFANGVGMAIAQRFLADRYNRPAPRDRRLVDLRDLLRRRPDGGRQLRRRRRSPATSGSAGSSTSTTTTTSRSTARRRSRSRPRTRASASRRTAGTSSTSTTRRISTRCSARSRRRRPRRSAPR